MIINLERYANRHPLFTPLPNIRNPQQTKHLYTSMLYQVLVHSQLRLFIVVRLQFTNCVCVCGVQPRPNPYFLLHTLTYTITTAYTTVILTVLYIHTYYTIHALGVYYLYLYSCQWWVCNINLFFTLIQLTLK